MANKIYATVKVNRGDSISKMTYPSIDGYTFVGWSTVENGDVIDFPYTPTTNTTLYAVYSEKTSILVGFTGLTNSNSTLIWTDDIADLNIDDAYTTTTNGSNVTVTGALDDVFPFNQIEEYLDSYGNIFIKFPKVWIKWVYSGSALDGIQISSKEADGFFVPDCFLKPDGSGEYNDCFYMGKYEGSGSSSLLYSNTNATVLTGLNISSFRNACRAYGASTNYYNGYQQLDLSMVTLYNFLVMMYYRTSNISSVYIGRGNTSSKYTTGGTDNITGLNGWNTNNRCVKMLGVENPYGNVDKFVDGVYISTNNIYVCTLPTNFVTGNTNYWILTQYAPTSSGYVTTLLNNGTSYAYPISSSGTSGSYFGDYYFYTSANNYLAVGGNYGDDVGSNGIWKFRNFTSTNTGGYIGGRLCLRPS